MNIGEMCSRVVVLAHRDTPLSEVSKLMREHHVGSVVIIEDSTRGRLPIGIITDRDIVIEVIAMDMDCNEVSAGDIMSGELVTVLEDESIINALRLMRRRGVRRLPVLTQTGTLAGIVTLDDIMEIVGEEFVGITKTIASEQSKELHSRKPFMQN